MEIHGNDEDPRLPHCHLQDHEPAAALNAR
jgi:hypothetical protein